MSRELRVYHGHNNKPLLQASDTFQDCQYEYGSTPTDFFSLLDSFAIVPPNHEYQQPNEWTPHSNASTPDFLCTSPETRSEVDMASNVGGVSSAGNPYLQFAVDSNADPARPYVQQLDSLLVSPMDVLMQSPTLPVAGCDTPLFGSSPFSSSSLPTQFTHFNLFGTDVSTSRTTHAYPLQYSTSLDISGSSIASRLRTHPHPPPPPPPPQATPSGIFFKINTPASSRSEPSTSSHPSLLSSSYPSFPSSASRSPILPILASSGQQCLGKRRHVVRIETSTIKESRGSPAIALPKGKYMDGGLLIGVGEKGKVVPATPRTPSSGNGGGTLDFLIQRVPQWVSAEGGVRTSTVRRDSEPYAVSGRQGGSLALSLRRGDSAGFHSPCISDQS
ncbi:hypothetical protein BC830DRAFT_1105796 [Chytriomyces sp. MP71]|nr:hypothetical protein BC830DRAFT_1105796 [Chytriomyces sp. MP71]